MCSETSQPKALRALVIGAGPAAVAMHLPVLAGLRARRDVELVLICDLQRERAAAARREFGFAEESGDAVAALERPDIDVVYIFGSAQLHFEYGLVALRHGKHLFVEKPIAPSYEAACELARAAQLHGCVAVGGHNRRFYGALANARALAGKSGWRFAEAVFHKPEFGKPAPFGADSWLSANGIHALDVLVFMMNGLPEQLMSLAGETGAAQPAAFSAVMRWRDGAQGVFLCNNNAGVRREEYVFHGLGETCRIDDAGLVIEQGPNRPRTVSPAKDDGIAAEHDAFLESIRSGVEPVHSISAIAPSLFLCELIERGFSGPVRCPDTQARSSLPPRSPAQSILVVQPGELQPALVRLLSSSRMVSLADVQASAGQRPDIVAAILGRGADPLAPEILAKLPRLGIVGIVGLSVARHDPETLLARGIAVVNATQTYAESVAEFAFGLAILARRRAFTSHDIMRRGGWGTGIATPGFAGLVARVARRLRPVIRAVGMEHVLMRLWRTWHGAQVVSRDGSAEPRELRGATVGLIGWSANARAFAERLIQARARVLVYSEHASDLELGKAAVTRVSLGEALAADVVSLHRGLTPRTRHFLGEAELSKLRPGTVLINIARGALVEPTALLARLKRRDIFACLDTYEEEPLDAADPLRALPNVFLTSHIAGGSGDMHVAAADEVVRKIAAYLAGDTVEANVAERLQMMT
jgi:phosphoglycerate dehydrogenase-like enzyme/predicted dehydrogenase